MAGITSWGEPIPSEDYEYQQELRHASLRDYEDNEEEEEDDE